MNDQRLTNETVQQLHSALETAQKLAAARLLEIERLHEVIRRAVTHLRTIVQPYEGDLIENVPQPLRELRVVMDTLRQHVRPSAEPVAAPPDLWTCDECAGPPRPYEQVQCVMGNCKPVKSGGSHG